MHPIKCQTEIRINKLLKITSKNCNDLYLISILFKKFAIKKACDILNKLKNVAKRYAKISFVYNSDIYSSFNVSSY